MRVGVSLMKHRLDNGEHGRRRGRKSTTERVDDVPDVNRSQVYSPARIADTCVDLVSGILLVSSRLDTNGELVGPDISRSDSATTLARLRPSLAAIGASMVAALQAKRKRSKGP